MTIPLHPAQLAAMYDCLRAFPPFDRWKLPLADEVEFAVASSPGYYGWHERKAGTHRIVMSHANIGRFDTLAMFMAHEMIHLYQAERGTTPRGNASHNAEFRRLAARVCSIHGFDPKVFV